RQPRLVVILGDRSRRIDIAGGILRRHICRRAAQALPRTRGSRIFSGIVNHGLNLGADAADLKFLERPADRSGKSRGCRHLPLSVRSSLLEAAAMNREIRRRAPAARISSDAPLQDSSSALRGKASLRMISGTITALNRPLT